MILHSFKDEQLFLAPRQDGETVKVDVVDTAGKLVAAFLDINGGNVFITPLTQDHRRCLNLAAYGDTSVYVPSKNELYGWAKLRLPTIATIVATNPNDINTFLEPIQKEAA